MGRGEREEGDAEVDDEIVEVMGSDDEEETGQVFEAAARAAYSRWTDDQPTKLKHASAGAHTRVLSASFFFVFGHRANGIWETCGQRPLCPLMVATILVRRSTGLMTGC